MPISDRPTAQATAIIRYTHRPATIQRQPRFSPRPDSYDSKTATQTFYGATKQKSSLRKTNKPKSTKRKSSLNKPKSTKRKSSLRKTNKQKTTRRKSSLREPNKPKTTKQTSTLTRPALNT
ncbi:unnamed protein product [Penicillium roqueforti FM164]|uniref:Genomic scaffold, ProqFM164S01 n=1 Tax=Penicillium roqueforti (strain FM164) TaxID=1365484 RepID=W6Q637_PENRF|nr:unnamed protein product [Penicillium roqueforti FM164]